MKSFYEVLDNIINGSGGTNPIHTLANFCSIYISNPDTPQEEQSLAIQILNTLVKAGYNLDYRINENYPTISERLIKSGREDCLNSIINDNLTGSEFASFEEVSFEGDGKLKKAGKAVLNFLKNQNQNLLKLGMGRKNFEKAKLQTEYLENGAQGFSPAELKEFRKDVLGDKNLREIDQLYNKPESERYDSTGLNPTGLNKKVNFFATDEEKAKFIQTKLDTVLGTDAIKILSTGLSKLEKPFTSDLYKFLENYKKPIGEDVAKILGSEKYRGISKVLAETTNGLNPLNTESGSKQIKVIAYFHSSGYDLDELRKDGKWLSLTKMKDLVSGLSVKKPAGAKYEPEVPDKVLEDWLSKLNFIYSPDLDMDYIYRFCKSIGCPFPKGSLNSKNLIKAKKYGEKNQIKNLRAEYKRITGKEPINV